MRIIKHWWKLYQRNKNIRKLSFDNLLDICFLILPYIKAVKKIKEEYKGNSPIDLFKDIVENILSQLNKDNIQKILDIVYINSKNKTPKDIISDIPYIIHRNNLIEIFILLQELGVSND